MFTKCEVTLAWTIAMQIRGVSLHSVFPHACSRGPVCVPSYMQKLMRVCVHVRAGVYYI